MKLSESLFEYVPEGDLFRLSHLSVRDCLFSLQDHIDDEEMRQFCPREDSAHHEIAKACLALLSTPDLDNEVSVLRTINVSPLEAHEMRKISQRMNKQGDYLPSSERLAWLDPRRTLHSDK